ncbi:MAG: DUF4831 family protein [Bacteroidales bacterium]|nr:DUF4831 family protein [Bacteroidales bacterium]
MKSCLNYFIIILLLACSPVGNIMVTNVHDLAAYPENSIIYALPRTRIKITVTALKHEIIPGPYNKYAEKYLGIVGSPSVSTIMWEISDIVVNTNTEPDPDHYYALQTEEGKNVTSDLLEMTSNGLILKLDNYNPFIQFHDDYNDSPEPIHFTDLSVKRNIDGSSKPNKKGTDIPTDLPVSKKHTGVKSIEKKAEEAANFIIKIRKRRFKLLAGQYDVFPEGQALETSVRELNELEQEYLSLFTGKIYTDTVVRNFHYIPKPGTNLERNVFCRFSEENGFLDPLGAAGKALVLELKNKEFTSVLDHLQMPYEGPGKENIILYRIPDITEASIFYSSINILEAELKIFQYGKLVPYYFHK